MDHKLDVRRTIFIVDIEGFGDLQRTNRHEVEVRDGLACDKTRSATVCLASSASPPAPPGMAATSPVDLPQAATASEKCTDLFTAAWAPPGCPLP